MKPLVLQVRSSSTQRDVRMHCANQHGSGTSNTSDWKGQRKAWVAEQRQRRRASRAPQQRLQRSHLDEDALATGSRFSAFPRVIKALDRQSRDSELYTGDGGTYESRYSRAQARYYQEVPSSQDYEVFAKRSTSVHHRRSSKPSSASSSPVTAPVVRNRDRVEPVYEDSLGSPPLQLPQSSTPSRYPYDSTRPSSRSLRARNQTAWDGDSADQSEFALRRYTDDEAQPDAYQASAYTPRQYTRQTSGLQAEAWAPRASARIRFPGLQDSSVPPLLHPEAFTTYTSKDKIPYPRSTAWSSNYEIDDTAEYQGNSQAEYYRAASSQGSSYEPVPYLDTSATDWEVGAAPVEAQGSTYEQSGHTESFLEQRVSDSQYLEQTEAVSDNEFSPVALDHLLQPSRAAQDVAQSISADTGHGTYEQPSDGDVSPVKSQKSSCFDEPSPTRHSSSEDQTSAPSAVWESLFTKSKHSTDHKNTARVSGTPGGVWDSLFDEAASADSKHASPPKERSVAKRSRTDGSGHEQAHQSQVVADGDIPAGPSSSTLLDTPSVELNYRQSSAAAELQSLSNGSVTRTEDRTQDECPSRSPHMHASSSTQAATNAVDAQQHQQHYEQACAVGGEDAAAVQLAAHATQPESAQPKSGEMIDSVSGTVAATSKGGSAFTLSQAQAQEGKSGSSQQSRPGRDSAVYTAAGAAGASVFLLQALAPKENAKLPQQSQSPKRSIKEDSTEVPEAETSLAVAEDTPIEEESHPAAATAVADVLEAPSSFVDEHGRAARAPISGALAPDDARADGENTNTDMLVTADQVIAPEVLPEDGKMVLVTPQMQAPQIQSSMWSTVREDRWREQLPPSARKVVDFAEECGRVWGMMFPKKSEEQLRVEREILKAVMKGDLHWSALNQVKQGKPIKPEMIAEAKKMAQQ